MFSLFDNILKCSNFLLGDCDILSFKWFDYLTINNTIVSLTLQ